MRGFMIQWEPVRAGRLALDHRPRLRRIAYLPAAGCEHVVTLLSAAEGAEEIGQRVRAAGMAWTWIPLAGARPPEGRHERSARLAIADLARRLAAGESILIHCSAGIHRTGMVAYALLRVCGVNREAALDRIAAMRRHAREGLREDRLRWGDRRRSATHEPEKARTPPADQNPCR